MILQIGRKIALFAAYTQSFLYAFKLVVVNFTLPVKGLAKTDVLSRDRACISFIIAAYWGR